MRRILVLSLALSALVAAAAQAQQPVERRFALDADAAIRIHHQAGKLQVVGWERDSVAVTGRIAAPPASFGGGGSGRAGKINLWSGAGEPAAGELEIRVPRGATVWIKTATADVEASGLTGTLDVYSVSGRVFVQGSPQQLTAESMGGPVLLETNAAWLRAKTAGSPITLRGGGDDVQVRSVSGDITVESTGMRRGRFESVTGDIRFAGAVDRGASVAFDSHSGGVHATLPATLQADLSIATFKGKIGNVVGRSVAALLAGEEGLRRHEVTFVLGGGGGAEIFVQTFSGNIDLFTQP